VSELNFPMIGTVENFNQSLIEDLFIPLIDGDIIKYDKNGFFEVN
jgi:hypothetical protein